jgi:3-oxoacyl-[acyl-carrier-protein] synthase I
MNGVWVSSENIITSLGFSVDENVSNMLDNKTGISLIEDSGMAPDPFYASLVDSLKLRENFSSLGDPEKYTRFEKLAICSVHDALSGTGMNVSGTNTLFLLSTTKGNIDLLEKDKGYQFGTDRLYLWHTARVISNFFKFRNEPLVVSNACISGVQAIITGTRLIQSGYCENVIINGTDILSEFVVSGFNSFKSLSTGPCRPFDKTRDGLSLGEGSGTIVLTSNRSAINQTADIAIGEGFTTNDANHISGPSRTGEGLFMAIDRLIKKRPEEIHYISAHGTATPYNDEMESMAFTRARLQSVPVNSFKGYFGHTLGAAGVIESVLCMYSMKNNIVFGTKGFSESGVTNPLKVSNQTINTEIRNCLKSASGFGGCNAALLFTKV